MADLQVRMHSLELIPDMVILDNFLNCMQILMSQVLLSNDDFSNISSGECDQYRTQAAIFMLQIIAKNNLELVDGITLKVIILDFEWIFETLIELAKNPLLDLGSKISDLIIVICLKVPDIREFAISQSVIIFCDFKNSST